MHNLFFVYFNFYMFRAYLGPSSGGEPYVYNNWHLLFFLGDSVIVVPTWATDSLRISRGQLKCDSTRAETRFRLSAKRTSPFKSAGGRQFSRVLAAEVWASAVVMLDTPCSEVVWRVLATHCIRQFPPSLPLPCITVYHHISTGVYHLTREPFVESSLTVGIKLYNILRLAAGF